MTGFQPLGVGEWTRFGRNGQEMPTPQNSFKGLAGSRLGVDEIWTKIKSIACSDSPALIILMTFQRRGDRVGRLLL